MATDMDAEEDDEAAETLVIAIEAREELKHLRKLLRCFRGRAILLKKGFFFIYEYLFVLPHFWLKKSCRGVSIVNL